MKKVFLLSICIFFCFSFAFSQEESKDVKSGNILYKSNKFVDAEVAYRKGLEKNNESFEATFNLGDALYKQKKYEDAIKQFLKATTLEDDKSKIASAYHNIGNSYFQSKEYKKSIDAYKMALKQMPADNQTRYNLAMAQKYLKQQQQKQQQNKKQPQKKEEKMSEESAKQLLDASSQDEKEVQNRVKQNQQQQSKRPPVDKDW